MTYMKKDGKVNFKLGEEMTNDVINGSRARDKERTSDRRTESYRFICRGLDQIFLCPMLVRCLSHPFVNYNIYMMSLVFHSRQLMHG